MQGSERNVVIWWNCRINYVLHGVNSENNLSRCYLLDKKKPTESIDSIGFNQFFRQIITTCLLGDFLDIESEKPMVLA